MYSYLVLIKNKKKKEKKNNKKEVKAYGKIR
ncbi:unnamed protein product, partial [marine sediment metagenome]